MADNPEVVIVGKDGTEHVFPAGFDPKRAASIVSGAEAPRSNLQRLGDMVSSLPDVGIGAAKGAAHTVLDLGQTVHAIPGVSELVDALYGVKGLSQRSFDQARADTAYTNTPQKVGGGLETLAEMAVPVTKGVEALPSAARAGRTFESVMSAAKDVPIDVNGPGNVALRIQELADRGGSMPMAVRKLLNRMTAPSGTPITYEEARDFASNISRLSADEYGRLTPVVAREVANLRVALNKSIGDAAAKVGKLGDYESAMKEYANAAKLRDVLSRVWDGAKRAALPIAGASGAGYAITRAVKGAMGGE